VIYWDLRSAREHADLQAGLPPARFLSAPEKVFFARLKTPRRQKEWLLGRWAGKALVRAFLRSAGREVPAEAITIAPDPDGAPFVLIAGEGILRATLSLSHRDELALAVLIAEADAPLGADLEKVEPRSPGFVTDFFTPGEAARVADASDPCRAVTEVWALKEASLKAVRLGLSADTRRVEAVPRAVAAEGWGPSPVALSLPSLVAKGSAFVRDEGSYVVAVAWLGGTPKAAPSDLLRGQPVLDARPLGQEAAA